jgi:hypothetical protein
MRTLEIRRHSLRKTGGGSQLSQEGVDLARRVGATMGPFTRVAATVVPRSRETAIAMGFAVDYEIVTLVTDDAISAEFEDNRWWETPRPFQALAAVIARGGAAHRYGSAVVALWRDMMTALPDGGAGLVIGHSGQLEVALVACFPDAEHGAWGQPFACCEGARLVFDGEPARFTDVTILRVTGA